VVCFHTVGNEVSYFKSICHSNFCSYSYRNFRTTKRNLSQTFWL